LTRFGFVHLFFLSLALNFVVGGEHHEFSLGELLPKLAHRLAKLGCKEELKEQP
jgi:hypothetical protein